MAPDARRVVKKKKSREPKGADQPSFDWGAVRTKLYLALKPFPEARLAVAQAFAEEPEP
jgi:hypothetical protein